MESIQEKVIVDLILQHKKKVEFPEGLGGFEAVKEFRLVSNNGEMPLIWLESTSLPEVSFLTVDPFLFVQNYSPDFFEEDLDYLSIDSADEMLVLCIASARNVEKLGITANLAAPLLINWNSGIGKQILLKNSQEFSMEHPILPPQKNLTLDILKHRREKVQ